MASPRPRFYCADSTSFNNKTDVWEYGFGVTPSLGSNGCASTGSGYLRHRHTTYNTNTNYIARPSSAASGVCRRLSKVMDPNDNVIAETDYTFHDGTALLRCRAGRPVTIHTSTITIEFLVVRQLPWQCDWRDSQGIDPTPSSVSASATYDIAGNVHTATDANQNQTTFTYTPIPLLGARPLVAQSGRCGDPPSNAIWHLRWDPVHFRQLCKHIRVPDGDQKTH